MFIALEKEGASFYARLYEVISDKDDVITELQEAGYKEIGRCNKKEADVFLDNHFEDNDLDREYQTINYR